MSATEFRNCSPACAEMLGGHCPGETCVYKLTGAPTASIRQAHHHALEAYRCLTEYDRHYDDCQCLYCDAVGEISAALIEIKALAKDAA